MCAHTWDDERVTFWTTGSPLIQLVLIGGTGDSTAIGSTNQSRFSITAALQSLTRGDLFRLGHEATDPLAHDNAVLTQLWHVLVWGTGASQRGNEARIRSFARPDDRARNTVLLLKRAAQLASEGEPAAAYTGLIRPGGGQIRGLGPAFS